MAEPTSFNIAPAVRTQREQREKKESLKKRESNAHGGGGGGGGGGGAAGGGGSSSSSSLKRKASTVHQWPSPMRFSVPPPRAQDFDAPKDDVMVAHEPLPLMTPNDRQLYKPIDLAENKRGYRYSRAIADPLFPHKQYYRSTSPPPHYARLSFEDADKGMHFTTNALITTNEKGWRMVRSNLCAREGTLYYELKIHRGVPREGPDPDAAANGPQPHVRFGWARREAPLDAPVGFDGYSYGITDIRFETMHRSRPGKFFHSKKAAKGKSAKSSLAAPTPVVLAPEDQHIKEGDVIGVELQLPSLQLQQKVVSGIYNPAADFGDGFDQSAAPLDEPMDVIRDRIPVPYKANSYFEVLDHVSSKPMEVYADRTTNLSSLPTNAAGAPHNSKDAIKAIPNPNHEHPQLRTLPHSAIRVYKNGNLIGTAFENLLAFLPPASAPSKTMGAREGFDDGLVGYFPAVSCFWGGIAEVNFGDGRDGFWCPPAHLVPTRPRLNSEDPEMPDTGLDASGKKEGWNPGRRCRAVGERYKEQIAEDVVYDIIDEVDFFMQDGAYNGTAGSGVTGAIATGSSRLKEETVAI